jgi:ATP-dependent Clp protease, protease subunit
VRFGASSYTRFDAAAKRGEIFIYDSIGSGFFEGGVNPADIAEALKELTGVAELEILVNSPGGNVFDGMAIYNLLARFPAKKTTRIDGLAASIASVIALAGDKRVTAKNARWMVHEARTFRGGTAADMRKAAEELEGVTGAMADTYVERTGMKREEVLKLMNAETWMDAEDAKKFGFSHETTDGAGKPTAHAGHPILAYFAHTPDALRVVPAVEPVPPSPAEPAPEEKHIMFKTVLQFLGLAETGSEADVLAALTKRDAATTTQIATKDAQITALTTEKANLVAESVKLAAQVTELKTASEKAEMDSLIKLGLSERKITPAIEPVLRAAGIVHLKAFLEKAPPVVDPTETKEKKGGEVVAGELTDAERRNLSKVHGITEEQFLKHKAELQKRGVISA